MRTIFQVFSLVAFVLVVSSFSLVAAPSVPASSDSLTLENLDHFLNLAQQDAQNLIGQGVVCEDVGFQNIERNVQCGIMGHRVADDKSVQITTRCFMLCKDGSLTFGNFCTWPLVPSLTIDQGYCDN